MENVTKREKVIKGLECCGDQMKCSECPFDTNIGNCFSFMKADALELLKNEPCFAKRRLIAHTMFWCCPLCGTGITEGDMFCRMCGKAVKWDD